MRPRLVFVINSIGSGGAERVLDTLLRAAGDRGVRYDIHLVLLDREPEMRALPGFLTRHCLDARGGLVRSITALAALLGRLRPALTVSLLVRANIATALAAPGRSGAVLLCERMHLSSHLDGRYLGVHLAVLRLLPRLLYRRADRVLAVSEGVRCDLIDMLGVRADHVVTIENPYDLAAIAEAGAAPPPFPLPSAFIVAVGRLVAAKGFDLLIEAYRRADPAFVLVILGEGPDRADLEGRVVAAGLAGRIVLPGFVTNPYAVVARAAFLVSASRNEGFPNAIAEAMALGVPVIATDCPSGPAELIGGHALTSGRVVHAAHGVLVPDGDTAALAAAMIEMEDTTLRTRYAAAGRARLDDFRVETIAARYWETFDALLTRGTAAMVARPVRSGERNSAA